MFATPTLGSVLIARKLTEIAYQTADWRTLPIRETHEPLVQVPSEMCAPYYADVMHLTDDRRILVRAQVLAQLLVAQRNLSQISDLELMVLDGWRSLRVQDALFWHYLKLYTVEKFDLQEHFADTISPAEIQAAFQLLDPAIQRQLEDHNRRYVSLPSCDPSRPSPHSTGGAVDVWVYRNGQPADLGVPFDWMEESAGAFYHLKPGRLFFSVNDTEVCENRNALLLAMKEADFSSYPPEIWHFNYGNQMDSLVTGRTAHYSYVEPCSEALPPSD